jgi:hypothetical protein
MAKNLHPLIKRQRATQKTVDLCKGKAFVDWQNDCIKLMSRHARHMGRPVKIPRYHDAKSAADALRSLGASTIGEALDQLFERIEPHQILLGDIVEMPGKTASRAFRSRSAMAASSASTRAFRIATSCSR